MIAVESDVSDTRRWDESQDALDHAESGAQNRHQREFLSAHGPAGGGLERRVHGDRFEYEITRGFVRHEHRDFVHQFLELFGGRGAITQQGQFVPDQRMVDNTQGRQRGSRLG